MAQKTRHIGRHHQLLLRHGEGFGLTCVKLLIMCQHPETPTGIAFGYGKGNLRLSLFVCFKMGIEKGGLCEVPANRRKRFGIPFLGHHLFLRYHIQRHFRLRLTLQFGAAISYHHHLFQCCSSDHHHFLIER